MLQCFCCFQWSIPAGVEISEECRDLLCRMLVRDPDKRITMAEIHQHPWFTANLPVEVRVRAAWGGGMTGLRDGDTWGGWRSWGEALSITGSTCGFCNS